MHFFNFSYYTMAFLAFLAYSPILSSGQFDTFRLASGIIGNFDYSTLKNSSLKNKNNGEGSSQFQSYKTNQHRHKESFKDYKTNSELRVVHSENYQDPFSTSKPTSGSSSIEEKIFSILEVKKLQTKLTGKSFSVYRNHYLDDTFKYQLGLYNKKDQKVLMINTFMALPLNEKTLEALKNNCPLFERKNSRILCTSKLSFQVFRLPGQNGRYLGISPLQTSDKPKCLSTANFQTELFGQFQANFPLPTKGLSPPKLLLPLSQIKSRYWADQKLEYLPLSNKGHEFFLKPNPSSPFVCLPTTKDDSLLIVNGDNGDNCKTDKECISGCCKNNLCEPHRPSEGFTCNKSLGESCLTHSYCSWYENYPVFGLSRLKNGTCRIKEVSKGSYNRCINNKCLAIYEYVVQPKITDGEKLKSCDKNTDPDLLIITRSEEGTTKKIKYKP